MTRWLCAILCGFCFLPLVAQTPAVNGIAANYYRGFFWAHREEILHLGARTQGAEITFTRRTGSKGNSNNWEHVYRFPRIGLSFSFLDLGLPDITGYAIGILPHIELPVVVNNNSSLHFRMGTGVGYLTKKWDLEHNISNKAVGSHINGNMRLHFIFRHRLTAKSEINFGAGITHYSNGNFRMPNLGVNSVELMAGLTLWQREVRKIPLSERVVLPHQRRNRLEIIVFAGKRQINLIYAQRIVIPGFSAKWMRSLSHRSALGGGVDVFFDKGHVSPDNPADAVQHPHLSQYTEIGIKISHELNIGKFAFITDLGAYPYIPTLIKGRMYQRLGFKYQVSPHWAAITTLKTHFAKADFFEWGISYSILH